MSVYRIPVLLWSDGQNVHHGCPLDGGPESVATGETAADVLKQVKAFVEWQFKEGWRMSGPDFEEPRLETLRVPIRPQIEEDERTYPASQPVDLDIPCVLGKRESGLTVCAIPLLELEFDLHADEVLRTVVAERVRWALSAKSPRELAHLIAPPTLRIETININAKTRPQRNPLEPTLEALSAVATPLGTKALRRRVSRAWMRDELVSGLVARLGAERASVILLGPRGVGKSAVLIDAVRALESARVPEAKQSEESLLLFGKVKHRYWQTSAGRLIAGMKYLGQWEERLEEVIDEVSAIDGVLCVDNLLDLVRTGGEAPANSLAAFLTPFLQQGEVRLVGEATPEELDACRRLLPGFADGLQTLRIPEFDAATAAAVLEQVVATLERD